MNYDQEYAGELNKLSVFHNILEEFTPDDFGEDEFFVNDQRGFSVILKSMIDAISHNDHGSEVRQNYKVD